MSTLCRPLELCFGLPKGRKFCILLTGMEFVIINAVELRTYITSLGIQDKRDIGRVKWRVTQEYANSTAVTPFIV